MTNTRPEPITPRQLHDSHRWIPLDEVALLPGNPNQGHTESLDASLNEFGWIDGIIIHQGIVIAGNHRVEHARIAGETGLPGYDLSHLDLDDARRMAIALAHNHTTRLGRNDTQLLADALVGIAETDYDLASVAGYHDLTGRQLTAAHNAAVEAGIEPPTLETSGNYTRKIESPIYEPKGTQPEPTTLFDQTKTEQLLEQINTADLPAPVAEFLTAAAHRHTIFQYDQIAEFYAHTDPATQRLMEQSALVIIDFEQALENGFVKLSRLIADSFQ